MGQKVWVRAVALGAAIAAGLATAPSLAFAAWSTSGAGRGAGAAATMPSGATPSGTAGTGSVTLTWPAVTLSSGAPVAGYVITRYDTNGVAHAVNASCSGTVTGLSCTESSVPAGTWRYSDTPVDGGWTGGASPLSAPVTVP